GTHTLATENTRAVWIPVWLDQLLQDLRYAVRSMYRSPQFAIAAMLTLAVGIGAATAIYSIVDAILLRPLPFRDANRLVRIFENVPSRLAGAAPLQRGI